MMLRFPGVFSRMAKKKPGCNGHRCS
jgi:hypothetical protein